MESTINPDLLRTYEKTLAQAERGQWQVALLFIDLDKFKDINDELGHDAGDLVLKESADRMKNILRRGDTVARLGGDEFVIILPGIKNDAVTEDVARKVIDSIGQPVAFENSGETVYRSVGASIGISIYPDNSHDADSLIKAADQAMYLAKTAGRNQYARI